jgi:hypothetical protein
VHGCDDDPPGIGAGKSRNYGRLNLDQNGIVLICLGFLKKIIDLMQKS